MSLTDDTAAVSVFAPPPAPDAGVVEDVCAPDGTVIEGDGEVVVDTDAAAVGADGGAVVDTDGAVTEPKDARSAQPMGARSRPTARCLSMATTPTDAGVPAIVLEDGSTRPTPARASTAAAS